MSVPPDKPPAGRSRRIGLVFAIVAGGLVAAFGWLSFALRPTDPGAPIYVRFFTPKRTETAFQELAQRGILRNPLAMQLFSLVRKQRGTIPVGTYRLRPGMSADEIVNALNASIRQLIRLPETNWARRNASLLEREQVGTIDDYMSLVNQPTAFQGVVDFTLPSGSLEGYLYPDTYDFPPLLGMRPVIERQLKNFERKAWEPMGRPKDLDRLVRVASLVELETGTDHDRAMIAGVVENRLKKNMPLQIDASILYGLQKWRRLTFRDYKEFDSPYNLYRHKGLPPTPICSPSLKSLVAAAHPAHHDFLYYVALPNGHSLFAKDFDEHRANIKRRLAAMKQLAKQKGAKP